MIEIRIKIDLKDIHNPTGMVVEFKKEDVTRVECAAALLEIEKIKNEDLLTMEFENTLDLEFTNRRSL